MNYDNYSLSDIAAVTNGNRSNTGFGDSNGWYIILFLLVLFGGWGNRGYGFGGGNGGSYENYTLVSDFSQLSRQLADSTAMTERKLDGVNNGLCSLGYQELQNINGVNTNIFNATSGIQNTLTQGFAGLNTGMVQQGYETRIGINGIGTQLAQCCCDLKGLVAENKYQNAQNINALNNNITAGFTGIQNSMCLNTRDIISSQESGTRAILDAITANRIEDKNNQIAMLQTKLNNAELRASQEQQSNYLLNELKPCPKPTFITCNPWGCNCNQGCGCNC